MCLVCVTTLVTCSLTGLTVLQHLAVDRNRRVCECVCVCVLFVDRDEKHFFVNGACVNGRNSAQLR